VTRVHRLSLFPDGGSKRLLALGAHADDIEIGCGGTLLRLAAEHPDLDVTWVVLCSVPERAQEARASAQAFLEGVRHKRVIVKEFRDGFLPYHGGAVKNEFEALKAVVAPDVVLTHYRDDRHQDHRVVSDLTWNTWRNHLILEYEIPKVDGDFGSPSFFFPISSATLQQKVDLLLRAFPTQAEKPWFTRDLFHAVARIRGMECAAPEGLAEAFYCRKAVV
jgi:LmbE family N-acetylglucosaminyl deacetylase